MNKQNVVLFIVILGVVFSLGFYIGSRNGYTKGYEKASEENKVVYLNVSKLIEAQRKNFVDRYKVYKPEEITDEIKEKINAEIKNTSRKIVQAIREKYQDALIIDNTLEGCVFYQNDRKIPDITDEVIRIVNQQNN